MNINFYIEIATKSQKEFNLFQKHFFPIVMKWEGGGKLHNVKGDYGGWTLWGIAYNFNKRLFNGFNDFKDTTREEAAYIAFVKYYLAAKADKLPYHAKLYYFDMAYNMGVTRAIKILQQSVHIKADGVFGKITESKAKCVSEETLKLYREKRYNYLAGKSYRLRKFLKGWLNRSNSIYNFNY